MRGLRSELGRGEGGGCGEPEKRGVPGGVPWGEYGRRGCGAKKAGEGGARGVVLSSALGTLEEVEARPPRRRPMRPAMEELEGGEGGICGRGRGARV